jgi:membrane-bound serine protease (ClpP class)
MRRARWPGQGTCPPRTRAHTGDCWHAAGGLVAYRMQKSPRRPTAARTLLRAVSFAAIVLGFTGLALGQPPAASGASGEVRVLTLDDIINPVSARYVVRQIADAEEAGAEAVIIEIDTPGGLLDSTEAITSAALNARVPIITYVTPPGSRAASAGVFITMSGHVAAMAPNTRIGAATPVTGEGGDIPEDMRAKIINDTVQYARIIATERERNADWAEEAVRDAVVIDATEAVEIDVVDLIARDRSELVAEIHGMTVRLADRDHTLDTADAVVVEHGLSAFEDLLMVLSNPNVAFILLSLGTLGIYFELSNPGMFFPGVAGAIAIILALFSLGTLPINYAGLALLVLGLVLLGSEIWVTSGGVLGVGGAIAFLLGALLLIDDTQAPFMEVSRPLVYGVTLALVLFVLFVVRKVVLTRRRPAFISGDDMIGLEGMARGPDSVFVEGELWRARRSDDQAIPASGRVRVTGRQGFELIVEPFATEENGSPNDKEA